MRHSARRHTRAVTERPRALFWLAPAGIHRFIDSCSCALRLDVKNTSLARVTPGLGRIIADNRPCRFCAIAVTLATRTCIRLRAQQVGGLSSAAFPPPSAALSLSTIYMCAGYLLVMEVLTVKEGETALLLARTVLEQTIGGIKTGYPDLTAIFSRKRGVFVTLTKAGCLRGCIGFPYPTLSLGEAIREAALAAARDDPRFPPVGMHELPSLRIEVTVLSVPELLCVPPEQRPDAIEVGRHGLIVRGHGRSGLLLPQVPCEYGWNSATFLDHICEKAGFIKGCWQKGDVEIFTFEGQIFHEE
jgi:uncharacterized protein (TIGR00296 family)